MTIDQLRKAVRAEPFRPFTISLTDGRRFDVPHREFIWIPPEAARTIGVAGSGEDYSIIDLLLVTSLDFDRAKSRRRNGR
jgi:hypothetical protein